MEFYHYFPSVTFAGLTVGQFVGRDDGPLEQQLIKPNYLTMLQFVLRSFQVALGREWPSFFFLFGRTKFTHAQYISIMSISFPEAAILLVSDGDRDLWPGPTPEVRDSRTSRHSAHAQSQV